jgi:superfamily II DNA helicase RecQ
MRSLIPKQCQIMIFTATATKATKLQIIDTLQLSFDDVKMIEKSLDRPNISYVVNYLDKNEGSDRGSVFIFNLRGEIK